MISVHFQGKSFNITVVQVYAPTTNAKEAEVEQFYEDLQDLLELIPKRVVFFLIGDWNAEVGSQEIPGVTGKFSIGVKMKAGKKLMRFCQENALVIVNSLSILMKVKEESEKADLKTQHLNSKITADGDCSFEIKRCLFLGRKAMTNLYSILKSRNITLPTYDCLVKAMVFPAVT